LYGRTCRGSFRSTLNSVHTYLSECAISKVTFNQSAQLVYFFLVNILSNKLHVWHLCALQASIIINVESGWLTFYNNVYQPGSLNLFKQCYCVLIILGTYEKWGIPRYNDIGSELTTLCINEYIVLACRWYKCGNMWIFRSTIYHKYAHKLCRVIKRTFTNSIT
jgi:hypothetical protein